MSVLSKKYFHDEKIAFDHLESVLWPYGPVCPHCGERNRASKLKGKTTRLGLWKCYACRKQFTVKVGTVFESARIPLHKMLQAVYLITASKKGISAHQLHRTLGITYKSAWFLAHRIREAMKETDPKPMGGGGEVVEADETWFGNRKRGRTRMVWVNGKGWIAHRAGGAHAMKIISLVERGGRARSIHVPALTANSAKSVLRRNVVRKTTKLITDESNIYKAAGREFESHEAVNHSEFEWVRGMIHTNTIEGFFSIFKRGMRGIYQHCSEAHLHRYLAEFDFRYSERKLSDVERTGKALQGVVGKRLTYRRTDETAHA